MSYHQEGQDPRRQDRSREGRRPSQEGRGPKRYGKDAGRTGGDNRRRDDRGDRRWEDRGPKRDERGPRKNFDDRNRGGQRRDDRGDRRWEDRGPKRDERGPRKNFDDRNRGGQRRDDRGDRRWEDRGPKRDERGPRRDDRQRDDRQRDHRSRNQTGPKERGRGERAGGRIDTRAAVRESKENFPDVDADVTGEELDKSAQGELRYLDEYHRGWVSRHLVMAARYLEVDPELAFQHATAAARRGGRVGIVREAVGLAAYAAGKYHDALRELRTFRRISGDDEHLALIADCERATGRVEKALETVTSPEAHALKGAARAEAAIVEAGIRLDQGKPDEAVTALEIPSLDINRAFDFSPRLYEAYADALDAADRPEEAKRWRARIAVAERALGLEDDDEEIVDFGEGPDVEEPADLEAVAAIQAKEAAAREAKRAEREAKEAEKARAAELHRQAAEAKAAEEQADQEEPAVDRPTEDEDGDLLPEGAEDPLEAGKAAAEQSGPESL